VRPAAAALVCVLALLALAAPAGAQGQLLAEGDAVDLANALADAQEQQDVCYGWAVRINGVETDVGSSTGGPGQPLAPEECGRGYAQLEADLTYTCETCEGEDSVAVQIASDLERPPTVEELERLGYPASELLGENDDTAVVDMTGALPLLVADHGLAPYVEYELAREVPAADRPTGTPGSDLLRQSWPVLALCLFLLFLGPLYWFWQRRAT
jgi:hypothetical protein